MSEPPDVMDLMLKEGKAIPKLEINKQHSDASKVAFIIIFGNLGIKFTPKVINVIIKEEIHIIFGPIQNNSKTVN